MSPNLIALSSCWWTVQQKHCNMKEIMQRSSSIMSVRRFDNSHWGAHMIQTSYFQCLIIIDSSFHNWCIIYITLHRKPLKELNLLVRKQELLNLVHKETHLCQWMTQECHWGYKAKMLILMLCFGEPEVQWRNAMTPRNMTPENYWVTITAV